MIPPCVKSDFTYRCGTLTWSVCNSQFIFKLGHTQTTNKVIYFLYILAHSCGRLGSTLLLPCVFTNLMNSNTSHKVLVSSVCTKINLHLRGPNYWSELQSVISCFDGLWNMESDIETEGMGATLMLCRNSTPGSVIIISQIWTELFHKVQYYCWSEKHIVTVHSIVTLSDI